jgi:hypothetical protein
MEERSTDNADLNGSKEKKTIATKRHQKAQKGKPKNRFIFVSFRAFLWRVDLGF